MIRTYSMKWVKKHCTYQDDPEWIGQGSYTLKGHVGLLFTPNMSRAVCGKSFTIEAIQDNFILVKETPFCIPRWLLTKNSQKEVSHD